MEKTSSKGGESTVAAEDRGQKPTQDLSACEDEEPDAIDAELERRIEAMSRTELSAREKVRVQILEILSDEHAADLSDGELKRCFEPRVGAGTLTRYATNFIQDGSLTEADLVAYRQEYQQRTAREIDLLEQRVLNLKDLAEQAQREIAALRPSLDASLRLNQTPRTSRRLVRHGQVANSAASAGTT